MSGYPPFFEKVKKGDPDLYEYLTKQFDFIMKPGALDIKTKLLINLALDAIIGASEGVKNISKILKSMNVGDDAINESLRLAYQVGGLKVLTTNINAFE